MTDIATNITIISLALLAVVFILIALAWKGFENRFIRLSSDDKKLLGSTVLIPLVPILLLMVVTTWVGTYSPSLVPASAFLTMLGLAAISVLYSAIIGIKKLINIIFRKKKTSKNVSKIDELTVLYFMSLIFLGLTVFLCLFAILASMSTAMDLNMGGYQSQDFNSAKWLLSDAVMLFVSGTLGTGYSYLIDRSKIWRNAKDTTQK
jgi:uncharacterized membrane protein